MLLELAPGLRVVRRGPAHLQVGLYADRRVVLPRTAATLDLVDRIREHEPVDLAEPGVAAAVARLLAAGCARTLTGTRAEDAPRRVAVLGTLGDLGAPGEVDPAAALLRAAGLEPVPVRAEESDVVLVLAHGEPDRGRLDPFLRSARPHLVVRVVDGGVVVGPFVEPGRSACLRCVDAQQAAADPDHLSVLTRYVAATRAPRGDGALELAEPVLVHLGLAWAVRDLRVHLAGGRPGTRSTTVRLGPGASDVGQTAWSQHPECGCCWPGPGAG